MDRLKRVVTWILVITLVASIVGAGYLSLSPAPAGQTYTEFYILGPEGNASNYPTELNVSEDGVVIVGISNHERTTVEYQVVIAWNQTETQERIRQIAHDETLEFNVTVTAPSEPGIYRLRFLLYRTDMNATEPYRELSLRITVMGEGQSTGGNSG